MMEVDNEEVALFEAENHYQNDSAAVGASAEDSAFAAELAKADDKAVMMAFWNLAKVFGSIDVLTLFEVVDDRPPRS